ncbi:hypothetical protein K5I29_02955 [Flavobacterium agricola]|uniref:Uncharacterized protein n=1 Tax=Flavobacterium agricola TaxID=2870839 RepID=A0ABY6M0C6_9FLAO|nr:hypothetical protein [Flavobacterium agricola]UYW01891.1 hypothetical protein K5I29_02955 [Flavobacterium agricola]
MKYQLFVAAFLSITTSFAKETPKTQLTPTQLKEQQEKAAAAFDAKNYDEA